MQATIQYIHSELAAEYPKTEIEGFIRLIFHSLLGLSYTDIILHKDKKLSADEVTRIKAIVSRLKTFEPIQHILGETEFNDLKILVNKSTLIPRPETEELVHWVCNSEIENCSEILDIGTGSGCIALSLKKELSKANVCGVDLSVEALKVARQNAVLNGLDVTFKKADILDWQNASWNNYDIIVSNPPYVRNCEKVHMERNVLNYEPQTALFVEDDNPLLFYREIAEFALENLLDSGLLFFEINEYLGNEMIELLKDLGFRNIEIRKDLNGKDRMLRCQK